MAAEPGGLGEGGRTGGVCGGDEGGAEKNLQVVLLIAILGFHLSSYRIYGGE